MRQHLPQCSKCRGVLAASIQRRTLEGQLAFAARGATPDPIDPGQGRLFRSLAVVLSLLVLGSSATCWYLDIPLPGGRRALDQTSPTDVAHGTITGVE